MSTPYENEGEFGETELGEFGEAELEGEYGRYRRWGGPPRRIRRRFRRRPVSTQPVWFRRRRRWPVAPFGGGAGAIAVEPEPFRDEPLPPSEPPPPMNEPQAPADDASTPLPGDGPGGAPPDSPEESTEYELNVQPESFEAYSEFGETESFETGAAVRRPPTRPDSACIGLKQPEVIDKFAFDRDALTAVHMAHLKRIAQCIVASHRTRSPVRRVRLIGHTDPAGDANYNKRLGQRRALQVRQALSSLINQLKPGLVAQISFAVESRGEEVPIPGNAPASRRVQIFFPRLIAPPRRGCLPFKERVRLHLKVLVPPRRFSIATMLRSMRQVYGPAGFRVDVASQERLRIPALEELDVFCPGAATRVCCPFPCPTNRLNPEHIRLFRNRNRVRAREVVVYFVRSTVPGLNGCCAHPLGRPGVVVTANASQWTMAHEVGHVLGLQHVNNSDRLMTGGGTNNITNPPPNLIPPEVRIMQRSRLTIPC